MQLPDRVEIPSGCVHTFTICGVIMEVALVIPVIVYGGWILFHHLWVLIGIIPLWGFLVYHSRREPLFLKFWTGQLFCKAYYHS